MSKRPAFNLADLTSDAAAPMPEASQRHAEPASRPVPVAVVAEPPAPAPAPARSKPRVVEETKTANLQGLAFKVPATFRRRFRQRAANADLKLNELLFEALDAWEAARGLKK